ncbi:hypothetical protein QR680_015636 [Steinernema hermaphroditum]|uniref:Uncharacterized protein n=1 Tax=Steinernema hermaphroditum TaxID=289476 RepID=A0AA39H8S3_9BILA|nr:hypothetical protein QR680_015636 [Steinernema hermaphroditum]
MDRFSQRLLASVLAVAISKNEMDSNISADSAHTSVASLTTTSTTPVRPQTTTSLRTTTINPKILEGHQHMLYASMFTFSAIAIIMLIVMSFFGKRVRLSAWMFHTVNVSAWNALQLVNFAVVANDTPIPDFIKDQSFLNRSKEIQAGTLTMFAAGMIFLLPYHCLCYAFPHVSSNRFVTWLGWIPILLGINILVVILFTKRDFKDFFGPKPLDVYLFYVNSIYTFVFLTFCIAVMAAIVVYTCKLSIFFTRRDRKPDSDVNISSITFDLMNLIALVPYAYIIWIMGLFVNLFGFMGYTMRVISIDANILAEFAKYIPQSYIDYVMFMMKNDEYLQLFLPSVQLVLTCVAIPDYREQVCVLWCHETKYFR